MAPDCLLDSVSLVGENVSLILNKTNLGREKPFKQVLSLSEWKPGGPWRNYRRGGGGGGGGVGVGVGVACPGQATQV